MTSRFWILALVVIFILLGSIYLAVIWQDAHWVQRGGALLAALAASLAIMEATLEHQIAEKKTVEKVNNKPDRNISDFVSGIASRIRSARFRTTHSKLSVEKLRTVFVASLIAVLGEILHGFGDLIFNLIAHKFLGI